MANVAAQITERQLCIDACLDGYTLCQQMAMTHCLEMGGDHVAPAHLRLMADCAEICRTAAVLMSNGSPLHIELCALCAEVCRACAASCRKLDGMEECVRACERCAELCERVATLAPNSNGTGRPRSSAKRWGRSGNGKWEVGSGKYGADDRI